MILNSLSTCQIKAFAESISRINIFEGAVRSGKSLIALIRFAEEVRGGPEGEYVIAGRSENTILRNVIDPLTKLFGDIIRYNRGQSFFMLFGKKIYCVGANDERAELKIRGATFAGALVDEITAIPESFFKMLLSRLSVPQSKLIGTTNPDSPYHWLKKDFIDRQNELDIKVFKFTLNDNPGLSQEYIDSLKKEYTGVWRQRFIDGLWVQAEGAIYDSFDAGIHIVDIPHTYAQYYILGIDYGTTNAFCALLIGYNGQNHPHLWVEKEYYWDSKERGFQKTDAEYAIDVIKEFSSYSPSITYVDPSAASFIQELKRQRKTVVQANNDVIDGIRYVSSLFASKDLIVCRKCKNLIQSIQSYVWNSKSAIDGIERPLKQSDHACDALRYAVYTHFGNASSLKQIPESEKKLQAQLKKWNQNPMMSQGLGPNSYGWTSAPLHR